MLNNFTELHTCTFSEILENWNFFAVSDDVWQTHAQQRGEFSLHFAVSRCSICYEAFISFIFFIVCLKGGDLPRIGYLDHYFLV